MDYFDYSIFRNLIYKFPELSLDMLKYGIAFNMSTSKISIEWRDTNITGFEIYDNQIHRNTYEGY